MSIIHDNVIEVKLTRGLVTIIDAEDLEFVSQWKWFASRGNSTDYAQRNDRSEGIRRTVKLHRVILNAPDGMHVDHINHNGLDNRKANIRLCTPSENLRNRRKRNGCSSEYKGVIRRQDRVKPWVAVIKVDGKKYTSSFLTELEAALWYDEMAKEHHGEFAQLNFPQTLEGNDLTRTKELER